MKLLRFGEPENERPGLLDADGTIRDLSSRGRTPPGANSRRRGAMPIHAVTVRVARISHSDRLERMTATKERFSVA